MAYHSRQRPANLNLLPGNEMANQVRMSAEELEQSQIGIAQILVSALTGILNILLGLLL